MIPNYTRGENYFGRLGRYLATGKADHSGTATDRVAWMSYREIDADMPWRVASEIMAATARSAPRQSCAKPTLHFMWSASPEDRKLQRGEWEAIADRTIERMGLAGHQAVIVEHNDTHYDGKPRQHIHLMINAVREDGRAWRRQSARNPENWGSGDYKWKSRLDELAREFEATFNLRGLDTPLTAYREGREWPHPRPQKRAEREIDARTGRTPDIPMAPTDIKVLAPAARAIFAAGTSWDEIAAGLSGELGLMLKVKGQGLILSASDGRYAKLSALGKVRLGGAGAERLSKHRIAAVVGETFEEFWARAGQTASADHGRLAAHTSLTPPTALASDPTSVESPPAASANGEGRGEANAASSLEDASKAPRPQKPRHEAPRLRPRAQQPIETVAADDMTGEVPFEYGKTLVEFDDDAVDAYRRYLADAIQLAASWARIEAIARSQSLMVYDGWALHDGHHYLRLSALDGVLPRQRAERFGETYRAYQARSAQGLTLSQWREVQRQPLAPRRRGHDDGQDQEL